MFDSDISGEFFYDIFSKHPYCQKAVRFPETDQYWIAVVNFLQSNCPVDSRLFGPREFLRKFPTLYGYGCGHAFEVDDFDYLIIHKGMLDCLTTNYLAVIENKKMFPVFANEVFVVLGNVFTHAYGDSPHYTSLIEAVDHEIARRHEEIGSNDVAIVVTTYNRSWALQRSLPQMACMNAPIIVVDDGSFPEQSVKNREIAEQNNATYLLLPNNLGVAGAINIGLTYWLSDPTIQWISYHQDDIDIHPDCLDILMALGDRTLRPLLTGRKPPEFDDYGSIELMGRKLFLYRDCPGLQLLGHREYWQKVLPLPTAYLGAPKKGRGLGGMGPEEDHWITAWSPDSVTKKGQFVYCVPGLVRTFSRSADQSCWGNEAEFEDPPLDRGRLIPIPPA